MKFEYRELNDYVVPGGIQTGPFGSQLKAVEYEPTGVPVVMPRDLVEGRVSIENIARVPESTAQRLKRHRCETGDILFARRGEIGRLALILESNRGWLCGTGCLRIRPNSETLPDLLAVALLRQECVDWLTKNAVGQTMLNLNTEILKALPIALPPLPEQRKIADILTTWDETLEKLDSFIQAQERRKKALMQQLLSGKKRFPGFKGKWKTVSLGDVLEPITRPTAKPRGKFLAAGIRSHGKGVFLKHDFIPANIALDELFELKTGDLVVNITFAWEGAAAIVPPEADGALVSHRFPAFGFREGKAARSFFRHYIRTQRFVFDCGLASPGGAGRNRVLSKSAFLNIELSVPPIEEQQKIGDLLDTANQELLLLRTQRTALDQQKRGLMQLLLTGKLRVKL